MRLLKHSCTRWKHSCVHSCLGNGVDFVCFDPDVENTVADKYASSNSNACEKQEDGDSYAKPKNAIGAGISGNGAPSTQKSQVSCFHHPCADKHMVLWWFFPFFGNSVPSTWKSLMSWFFRHFSANEYMAVMPPLQILTNMNKHTRRPVRACRRPHRVCRSTRNPSMTKSTWTKRSAFT